MKINKNFDEKPLADLKKLLDLDDLLFLDENGKYYADITDLELRNLILNSHELNIFLKIKIIIYKGTIFISNLPDSKTWAKKDKNQPQTVSFDNLIILTRLIPSKSLRKNLKKLIADESYEIRELQINRNFRTARWRTILVYLNWGRYILSEPLTFTLKIIKKLHTN